MRNAWLVIRHEIVTTVTSRTFWIMTFLFPLVIMGLNIGMQVMSERTIQSEREAARNGAAYTVGYVDASGLIAQFPAQVPADALRAYPDEATAQAALDAGEIGGYYIVPADWIAEGELVFVGSSFRPMTDLPSVRLFRFLLDYNMTGDQALAGLLYDPTPRVQLTSLAPKTGDERQTQLSFWVPYAIMFVFFFSLTISGGLMLQSVSKEKETRTAEVLLLSLRPRELMLGKLCGLGLVALFQMLVWVGGGLLLLNRGGDLLGPAAALTLPPGYVAWLVAYFVFGYAAYASVLGAMGVLAPTAREGAQFTFIVILPMMIPLWLNNLFVEDPSGTLATFLSLFPPTAPLAMATRLAVTSVPLWQPFLALAGLAAMAYGFVLLAARLFRADTLLSYASLNLQRLVKEMRKRSY